MKLTPIWKKKKIGSTISASQNYIVNFWISVSEVAPPLPERNYYDEELAGEYTELRIDAPPPQKQQHQIPPESSKSMQHSEQVAADERDLYVSKEDQDRMQQDLSGLSKSLWTFVITWCR